MSDDEPVTEYSQKGLCGTRLFEPGIPVMRLAAYEIPVASHDLCYCGPVHGPSPLACALEPHPEGTWHRDGRGTWFR